MASVRSYFSSPSPFPLPSPSSSSPPRPAMNHDVFLSFRGEDTRNNFTSHLCKVFGDNGIDAFIDDKKLRSGDEICPSLLQAIEESQISVVIFSENYADSRWCLDELVKILECRNNHGQIVIPVFYQVDPSLVRKQTGSYAAAFEKHKVRFKKDLDKVQKWRSALEEVANISGFNSRVVVPESVLIEKIVGDVLERLNNNPSSDNKQLVEIESKIREIEVMLRMGDQMNNDVCSVGILGIGGIGKTTLAKAVCRKISYQFKRFCFVENVREALEKREPKCLREELYLAILGDKNICNDQLIRTRFSRMKLLIILDDVTSINQVDNLLGDLDSFGSGSRIIITSRYQQVLKNKVDYIYEVKELSFDNALKFFCRHAFKQDYPKIDYMELSNGVVQKIGGVPLALKVLGSFLLDKRKEVWESSMKKIENNLSKDIQEVLKISYDGLDCYQQQIFLDIACFFKGWDIHHVQKISEDIFTDDGLSALEDTCLIFISNNKLMMHDLLQAMGKTIVQQESIYPGKRTRLWNHKDICEVLTDATGTKKVEGISLDMSHTGDIHLHPNAFVNMPNLRFLQFDISNYLRDNTNKVHVPEDLKLHLTKLRYFQWINCPLKSLQSNFHMKNLVILKLPYSNVEQLWNGVQQFDHLKEIDLDWSHNLVRFPDLKGPKLECLSLIECASLIEMPSSFQHLIRLKKLSLSSCENLSSVPQLPESLKLIGLSGCSKLQRLPELPNNLEEIELKMCSNLIEIPSSIQHLTRLSYLNLRNCKSITRIPNCTSLIALKDFDVSHCSKLERLPEILDNFEELNLEGCTSLFEIPSSFKSLKKVKRLILKRCKSLMSMPDLMDWKSLTHLTIESCSKLKVLPRLPKSIRVLLVKKMPIEGWSPSLLPPSIEFFHNLRELSLIKCGVTSMPDSVSSLTLLEKLELEGNDFEIIPEGTINLPNLRCLNVNYCERIKVLPKLPWAHIDARNCSSLHELVSPAIPKDFFAIDADYNRVMTANFVNCCKLDKNSFDSFANDIQLEIQAQSPSYHKVYEGKDPPLSMCYPSNQIPDWFDFQTTGSFIDVKLPLDCIKQNFLCFALCVELPNNLPDWSSPYITYQCYVKSKQGGNHNRYRMSGLLGGFCSPSNSGIKSSHVVIGFGFHFFRKLQDNEFTFQFHSLYEVEKCGVHLICGKHIYKMDQNEEVDEPHNEESKEDEPQRWS